MRNLVCAVAATAILMVPNLAMADILASADFRLSVTVPVVCRIAFDADVRETDGGAWNLGRTREFCNNARGYAVVAIYEPGTLVGAQIEVGGRSVTLDGSGSANVYAASTAAITSRDVSITPGEAGFDTEILTFSIQSA